MTGMWEPLDGPVNCCSMTIALTAATSIIMVFGLRVTRWVRTHL